MTAVALFYAQILFDIDSQCEKELNDLRVSMEEEALLFFNSPIVSFAEKKQIIQKLPLSKNLKEFLCQLTLKKRWKYFFSICEQYFHLKDQKQNIIRGTVCSSRILSSEEKQKIENKMKTFFPHQTILLKNEVHQNLINGVKVNLGGQSFEDTVNQYLKEFKYHVQSEIS